MEYAEELLIRHKIRISHHDTYTPLRLHKLAEFSCYIRSLNVVPSGDSILGSA